MLLNNDSLPFYWFTAWTILVDEITSHTGFLVTESGLFLSTMAFSVQILFNGRILVIFKKKISLFRFRELLFQAQTIFWAQTMFNSSIHTEINDLFVTVGQWLRKQCSISANNIYNRRKFGRSDTDYFCKVFFFFFCCNSKYIV